MTTITRKDFYTGVLETGTTIPDKERRLRPLSFAGEGWKNTSNLHAHMDSKFVVLESIPIELVCLYIYYEPYAKPPIEKIRVAEQGHFTNDRFIDHISLDPITWFVKYGDTMVIP